MIIACTLGVMAVAMDMFSLCRREILPLGIRQECAKLHIDEKYFQGRLRPNN
jgi:hypothetical protein